MGPGGDLVLGTYRVMLRADSREGSAGRLGQPLIPSGRPRAAAIRAALAARRGDRGVQRAALIAAIEGFERVEMALHADAARLQLAAIEGSAASWKAAEDRMRAEDVRDPVALLRTLVPRPEHPPQDARPEVRPATAPGSNFIASPPQQIRHAERTR